MLAPRTALSKRSLAVLLSALCAVCGCARHQEREASRVEGDRQEEGARDAAPSASSEARRPAEEAPRVEVPRRLVARVVREYPHATDAFTEGLVFHLGSLFESTGRKGDLRRLSLEQAQPLWREPVPGVFPEGLASDGERLFQLTWKSEKLFVWEGSPPRRQRTLRYSGEGWGLCYRRGLLVRSDGSATLHLHDPADFREVSQLTVTLRGQPVKWLNELECTEGALYANVWVSTRQAKSSDVMQIDPETGVVMAVIDASALVRAAKIHDPEASLNGIAIEPESGRIFLTGKYWPTLFEVTFEPVP